MAIVHEQQTIPTMNEKHADEHHRGARQPIPLDRLGLPVENSDTTLHASTTQHGLLRKLSGLVADVFRGDGTWGAPPAVAPAAHAASHKNGGSDEISTATPAAAAIPKADANGQLVDWVRTKWTAQTTDGTQTEAFVNGVSNSRFAIPNNSALRMIVEIIAKTPGAANVLAMTYRAYGFNNAGTVTWAYSQVAFDGSGTITGWAISWSANQTDKTVRPLVTGATGQTVNWTITATATSVAD